MVEPEDDNDVEEAGDPAVPTDLLELHVALEDDNMTPEEFKGVFGQ